MTTHRIDADKATIQVYEETSGMVELFPSST